MSDQYNSPMDQNEFMKRMKAIASDLWGGVMPVASEAPAAAEPAQPKPAVKETEKPGTEIKNLWKTADESIDWTDALSHSTPADGLTSLKMWSFYHKHAEKVLAGDLDAYTEVLQKANPLGELTDYAENISMRAVSASKLESTFICKADCPGPAGLPAGGGSDREGRVRGRNRVYRHVSAAAAAASELHVCGSGGIVRGMRRRIQGYLKKTGKGAD